MHVDFEFQPKTPIDRIELHCSHDQWNLALRLDRIPSKLEQLEDPSLGDLRRNATRAIRSHGIHYLMIGNDDPAAAPLARDPEGWGVRLAAHTGAGNLYEIP